MKYVKIDKSKIKLKIETISTVVDEKNRRVIHKVYWHLDMDHLFSALLGDIVIPVEYWRIAGIAKGVAVCHPDDQFNEEVGKRIARAMAESNAYNNAARRLIRRIGVLRNNVKVLCDQAADFVIKTDDIILHNNAYKKSIVK